MFDVKTLNATPGMARRLINYSTLNKISFDEKLVDLAMQDIVSKEDLFDFPFDLPNNAVSTIQHIRDWNGRAMVLCSKSEEARHVAMADLWLKPSSKVLVLAQTKSYTDWVDLFRAVMPDAKISIFGNPRYHSSAVKYPDGIQFTEDADFTADVFITNYSGLIWNDFFANVTVDRTFVEELEGPGALPYKWSTQVAALFNEVPCPLFLQNINHLPLSSGRDIMSSLLLPGSQASQFLSEIINKMLWPSTTISTILNSIETKAAEEYLAKRSYVNLDYIKLLNIVGVSSDLLNDATTTGPLTFYETSLPTLLAKQNKSSGLIRLHTRERDLEQSEGRKLPEIVQSAIGGDRASAGLIGALRTPQWATLKGQHLKGVHGSIANRLTRSLFLAENPDLIRALRLQFGTAIRTIGDEPEMDVMGFTGLVMPGVIWKRVYDVKPVSNLIVTMEDLITYPDLLNKAAYLFMPELPFDKEEYQAISEAATASGTRLVLTVIKSTFEQELFQQLT